MTNTQIKQLHKLPNREKFFLAQMLWEDIAKEQNIDEFPAEHKKILDERVEKMKTGKAKFKSWEEVQKKYKKT
ncbi:MAG: addiction module protein [Bacteroidota bacterium]